MFKRIIYIVSILIIIAIIVVVYSIWNENNKENNVDLYDNTTEEQVTVYDTLSKSTLNKYLYRDSSSKLIYEGGPVHWGSKTIEYTNDFKTSNSVGVNLKVTDDSDLKGEEPPKVWNERWELKVEGLYIDGILAIKFPIAIGQSWQVTNYSPIIAKDKKYTANIQIVEVNNDFNDGYSGTEQIKTKLTIDDISMNGGGIYTETTTYEEGIGVLKKEITEPTIKDFTLSYWFDRKSNI